MLGIPGCNFRVLKTGLDAMRGILYSFPMDVSKGDLVSKKSFLPGDIAVTILINQGLSDSIDAYYSTDESTGVEIGGSRVSGCISTDGILPGERSRYL